MSRSQQDVGAGVGLQDQPDPALPPGSTERVRSQVALRRRGRRLLRAGLLGVGLVVCVALGAGLATMALPTRTQVGGARASVTLNLSNHITVDPGSRTLLSYRRPSPLPLVGIHAVVDSFGVGFTPQHALAIDPEVQAAYAQFFSNPKQDQTNIRHGIEHRAEAGAAAGTLLFGLLAVGLPLARRRRAARHPEVQHALDLLRRRYGRGLVIAAGVVVTGLVAAAAPGVAHGETVSLTPDPSLAGSPFAGGQIDGALAGPVEFAAQTVTGRVTAGNHYYDRLRTQVADAVTAEQAALATPAGDRDVLVISDLHCNIGMDRVIGQVVRQLKLHLVLDAGDNAFSGSFGFEAACNTQLSQALPRNTDMVLAPGNHDSPLTDKAAAKAGTTVLGGTPVSVRGLRILGSPDPRSSRYGQGLQPADGRSQQTLLGVQAYQLATTACQAKAAGAPVDVVMVHDPQVAASVAGAGCGVGLGIAGHTHRLRPLAPLATGVGSRGGSATSGSATTGSATAGAATTGSANTGSANTGSANTGSANTGSANTGAPSTGTPSGSAAADKDPAPMVLTEGSTGGAGVAQVGQVTVVGPLLDTATMTVLRFDQANQLVGSYDIQVHPDGTVQIGSLRPAVPPGLIAKLDRLSSGGAGRRS